MQRSRPTTKSDVIGPLCLKPVKVVKEYIESKKNASLLIKRPSLNITANSIDLMAIENDAENAAMFKLQRQMRDRAERQYNIDTHRIENLDKIAKVLRSDFIDTSTFLQNCDVKRLQALKVVTEQKKLHTMYKNDNEELKNGVELLHAFRNDLAETVKKLEPYEKVIDEAVAAQNIWTSPKDCINRCDALMLTQDEIAEHNLQTVNKIEVLRKSMAKMSSEAALTILGLNTTLIEWERRLTAARSECIYWETVVVKIKDCLIQGPLTKDRLNDGIGNMYHLLCRFRGTTPTRIYAQLEDRFDFIRDEIRILREVLRQCNLEVGKEARQSKRRLRRRINAK